MRELDRLLQVQRQAPSDLPDGLAARILRDATQVQAGFAPQPRPGVGAVWQQLRVALGGWPAMGGLIAACAAGVWLGLAPPATLPDPAALFSDASNDSLALFSGDDLAFALLEDR